MRQKHIPSTVSALLAGLAALASAKQPSSPEAPKSPLRDLVWGQLNIIHTTDTHGWHAGHLLEPNYSADWGDYISFVTHMRRIADEKGVDILVIDTGDRVDGNGLYDASTPKGLYTSEIFKQQTVDVLCTGNHELYVKVTAEREYNVTVPNFKDSYLSSNLDIIRPGLEGGDRVPMSRRYKIFKTPNQGLRILSFGFIFDFNGGAPNVFVRPVSETIKEEWFQSAIREPDIDVFIVIGHVAPRSKEWKAVYEEVRKRHWDTPILFLSGHSHVRDFVQLDSKAVALQSGRYLETVGWLSVDGITKSLSSPDNSFNDEGSDDTEDQKQEEDTAELRKGNTKTITFNRRYIDNNLHSYHHHSKLLATSSPPFDTEQGRNVSFYIAEKREELDLGKTYGCAPRDFYVNRAPYPHQDSLFTLMVDRLLSDVLSEPKHGTDAFQKREELFAATHQAQNNEEGQKERERLGHKTPERATLDANNAARRKVALMNTGGLRFDVFKGKFTRDSVYIISPFENQWRVIRRVEWGVAKHVLPLINSGGEVLKALKERGDFVDDVMKDGMDGVPVILKEAIADLPADLDEEEMLWRGSVVGSLEVFGLETRYMKAKRAVKVGRKRGDKVGGRRDGERVEEVVRLRKDIRESRGERRERLGEGGSATRLTMEGSDGARDLNFDADNQPILTPWLAPPEQIAWRSDRLASQESQTTMEQQPLAGDRQMLTPGYTTHDDAGDDGDDTVHSSVSYYKVPSAIQANIGFEHTTELKDTDEVDVVFLDFIQPWVVLALRYSGKKVVADDVESYLDGKGFTTMIKGWVQENWKGEC